MQTILRSNDLVFSQLFIWHGPWFHFLYLFCVYNLLEPVENTTNIFISNDVTGVSCGISLWNSTEWFTSFMPIQVAGYNNITQGLEWQMLHVTCYNQKVLLSFILNLFIATKPPSIVSNNLNITFDLGSANHVIQCIVDGIPRPTVKWMRHGKVSS